MCRQWHPLISGLLDTPGFHPPSTVTLRMVPTIGGASGRIGTPGVTSGQVITVGADWVDEHPDDTGLVLHELVHVVQSYPSGEPWWVTEGIADWVRYQRVETDHPAATPHIRGRSYTDGYAVTAAFLEWIERSLGARIVLALNDAMRRGRWSDSIFVNTAGAPVGDLWDRFARESIGLR
jgi:hypothetical protein